MALAGSLVINIAAQTTQLEAGLAKGRGAVNAAMGAIQLQAGKGEQAFRGLAMSGQNLVEVVARGGGLQGAFTSALGPLQAMLFLIQPPLIGAVAGLVAGLAAGLIPKLFGTGTAAKAAADDLKSLKDSISSLEERKKISQKLREFGGGDILKSITEQIEGRKNILAKALVQMDELEAKTRTRPPSTQLFGEPLPEHFLAADTLADEISRLRTELENLQHERRKLVKLASERGRFEADLTRLADLPAKELKLLSERFPEVTKAANQLFDAFKRAQNLTVFDRIGNTLQNLKQRAEDAKQRAQEIAQADAERAKSARELRREIVSRRATAFQAALERLQQAPKGAGEALLRGTAEAAVAAAPGRADDELRKLANKQVQLQEQLLRIAAQLAVPVLVAF